jgi:LAS superfamily LD-carboxypeptidase LdcB
VPRAWVFDGPPRIDITEWGDGGLLGHRLFSGARAWRYLERMPDELARALYRATRSDVGPTNLIARKDMLPALEHEFATGRLLAWLPPDEPVTGAALPPATADAARTPVEPAAAPAGNAETVATEKRGQGRIPHRRPPEELVDLTGINKPGHPKKVKLEKHAAAAYGRLLTHARAEGFGAPLFLIVSGYRDQKKQADLYAQALKKYGSAAEAQKWVAPPGRSAHGTGCAVDLWLGFPCGKEFDGDIKRTAAYKWLAEHAAEHGWNPYDREGWHWEYYVGD